MDELKLADKIFQSRLFVGTGKFSSNEMMGRAVSASGSELVTVALKRFNLDDNEDDMLSHLKLPGVNLLPNTSGVRTAKEAVFAAELARKVGTEVVLDIDFRPDQWHDPRAFGVTVRSVLPNVDIVIGTEDEINAAMLVDAGQISLTHSQISDARVEGDIDDAIRTLLSLGPKALLQKRGEDGVRVHLRREDGSSEHIDVPGYPVKIHNILGAGDAFGSGFLYGYVNDWGWYKSARLGNACGAIVVTKHGCANFMPTMQEVLDFVEDRGGF